MTKKIPKLYLLRMEVIKILYSSLLQERGEQEFLLEKVLNFPTNITTQIQDSKAILREIALLNLSIETLDKMLMTGEDENK